MPYPSSGMDDGWETRRRREPGNDWCIISLAAPGKINRIELDTAYFKGNFPDRCKLSGAFVKAGEDLEAVTWQPILEEQKLAADTVHKFSTEIVKHEPVSHVRLDIIPDGGVARLRCFGEAT